MNLFAKIRMQAKILILSIPPTLLFILFAVLFINTLIDTANRASWNHKILIHMNSYEKLNKALSRELRSIQDSSEQRQAELSKRFEATDQVIDSFQKNAAISEDRTLFSNKHHTRILQELTRLQTIREAALAEKNDFRAIEKFYLQLKEEILSEIEVLNAQQRTEKTISPLTSAYINLLREDFAAEKINFLVDDVILEKQISQETLINISAVVRAEQLYHKYFLMSNETALIKIYTEAMNDPSIAKVQEYLSQILSGKIDMTMEEWETANAEKEHMMNLVTKTILEYILNKSENIKDTATSNLITIACVGSAVLLMIILLGIAIIKDIAKSVTEMSGEIAIISNSSSDIVSAVAELSTGQKETAASVVETFTTMEELQKTSEQTNKSSDDTLGVANETREILQSSSIATQNTIENLNQIQEKMGVITDSTTKLNEHCNSIGQVIDSVHDLAEQSHVLAVNASIEAAKAGEHGKGFAVVAMEVRNLADLSKQATTKVHGILSDIQNAMNNTILATEQGSSAVTKGVEQSSATTGLMQQLIEKMATLIATAEQIHSATEQQFNVVDQTKEAINNVQTASDHQLKQCKVLEKNIDNLHNVTKNLEEIMHRFKAIKAIQDAEKNNEQQ